MCIVHVFLPVSETEWQHYFTWDGVNTHTLITLTNHIYFRIEKIYVMGFNVAHIYCKHTHVYNREYIFEIQISIRVVHFYHYHFNTIIFKRHRNISPKIAWIWEPAACGGIIMFTSQQQVLFTDTPFNGQFSDWWPDVKVELWNIARFPKSIHHTEYKTRLH